MAKAASSSSVTRGLLVLGGVIFVVLLIVGGLRGVGQISVAPGDSQVDHAKLAREAVRAEMSGVIDKLTGERDAALANAGKKQAPAAPQIPVAKIEFNPIASPKEVLDKLDVSSLGRRDLPSRGTPLSRKPVQGRPNTGAKAHAPCRYVFDRYEASSWEKKYFDNINDYQTHVCDVMNKQFHDLAMKYKDELSKCSFDKISDDHSPMPTTCDRPKAPVKFDESVFSKMHYKLVCDGSELGKAASKGMPETQTSFIEPLVGMLRHPLFCFDQFGGPHGKLTNKNYMVFDEWSIKKNYPFVDAVEPGSAAKPRVFLFDAGGSIWSDGESQAWFHHHMQRFCLDIDGGYFIWETTNHDPRKVMSVVPGHVKPFYHWFNSFTNANDDSWDNPVNILLRLAEPEDYVIFKLDIDKYEIERPILDAILNTPALMERVDEFYFEHHVTVEPMMAWWGSSASASEFQNTSMHLFTELRKRGIRSHSWV